MMRSFQLVERPGTQLVHVAVIVPQDALHCQKITGAGLFKDRQGQKHPAVECGLLHTCFLPPLSSNLCRNLFKVFVRWRWTALRDSPTRPPISPSSIAATQCSIKICCSCSGKVAKAPATSSSRICRSYPKAENVKLSLGYSSSVQSLSISACGKVSSDFSRSRR